MMMMMEKKEEAVGGGTSGWSAGILVEEHWYWCAASFGQLIWGISSLRRGYAGDSRLMPLKAFAVASLFLGSLATAGMGSVRASGIHSVDDLRVLGANIRAGMGVRPRSRGE